MQALVIFLSSFKIMPIVYSATAYALWAGQLMTFTPFSFAASISIFSTPPRQDKIREEGCEPVTKEELLKRSDVVTIHARINAGDPPIIGKEEFGQMKETAYLINTARAVAVDMKELYHALSEHKIMGAAIDVFPTEPVKKMNHC